MHATKDSCDSPKYQFGSIIKHVPFKDSWNTLKGTCGKGIVTPSKYRCPGSPGTPVPCLSPRKGLKTWNRCSFMHFPFSWQNIQFHLPSPVFFPLLFFPFPSSLLSFSSLSTIQWVNCIAVPDLFNKTWDYPERKVKLAHDRVQNKRISLSSDEMFSNPISTLASWTAFRAPRYHLGFFHSFIHSFPHSSSSSSLFFSFFFFLLQKNCFFHPAVGGRRERGREEGEEEEEKEEEAGITI